MSLKNSRDEILSWSVDNMNKIIEIYSDQKKSDWIQIPANQENENNISPFHMVINLSDDALEYYPDLKGRNDLIFLLKVADKVINYIFKVNNSSCIVLQQSRRHKEVRIIYPELFLTYNNEHKLLVTLNKYIPVYEDTDTQLPNSGKYKCVGIFNIDTEEITPEDSLWLTSLNGIQFSQVLGQIHRNIYKHETEFK